MKPAGPPRAATRLLELALPRGASGRSILGDLREEWSSRPRGVGRDLWYWAECARLAASYGGARLAAGPLALHRGVAPAFRGVGEDLRATLLRLGRSPVQLALVVLALGLGVAAPATMFAVVAGITRDLDVPDPERLVHVGRRGGPVVAFAPGEWLLPLLDGVDGLESVGLFAGASFDLSGDGGPPERLRGNRVTSGVFRALGVGAAVGRVTTTADEAPGAEPVVVLAWDVWQGRFGGDPELLGRAVRLDGVARTVVGVMPPGFHFRYDASAWVPLQVGAPDSLPALEAVGRLAPGASVEGVQVRVRAITEALRDRGERIPEGSGLEAQSWRYRMIAREHRVMLAGMVLLASFVLLIACADVANLMVARAVVGARDTAVRIALGAGRWRVVRRSLLEALVVSCMAGVLGLGLASVALSVFVRRVAGFTAYWMDFRIDLPVLLFAALLVLAAALVSGLLPALQAGRVDAFPALREGGRGSSGFRIGRVARWLVTGEVALSCALLVVAGLMTRGALTTLRTDGSYETGSVLTARYELRRDAYATAEASALHRELLERLAGRPGLEAAALTSHLPGIFSIRRPLEVEGELYDREEDRPVVHAVFVTPGFFQAMGVGLLRGRDLAWQDGDEAAAVVVNEEFARRWLPGREPLGARLRLGPNGPWAQVVGVAPALGLNVGRDRDGSGVYFPLDAWEGRAPALVMRSAPGTDPHSLLPHLRGVLGELDPDLPLYEISTLAHQMARTHAIETVFATLFLAFGLAGLLLAAVGLYGLLAFTVGQRTRELGVRVALGAAPWRAAWSAVRSGAVQLAVGLVLGASIAAAAAPLLGEGLMGADPRDPLVYAAVAGVLAAAGALAASGPTRRALGMDVAASLRSD